METGGSNIQFAVIPKTGRMVVIEMNPRVSRSSALASKATGFPIAKIAAKLAVGYTLDELKNDITRETPACFEPSIDYCVVKVPRFDVREIPAGGSDPDHPDEKSSARRWPSAAPSRKRFKRRSDRLRPDGLDLAPTGRICRPSSRTVRPNFSLIEQKLRVPGHERIFFIRYALQAGLTVGQIHELSAIDPWFLENIRQIVEAESRVAR